MSHPWTKVSSRIWLDDRVTGLDPEGFKLFIYAVTNTDRTSIGLSRFSVGLASDITGIPYQKCESLVDKFTKPLPKGFGWRYDKGSNTILIPTWLDDVKIDGLNTLKGLLKSLSMVPATPLIVDWYVSACDILDGKELKGTGKEKLVISRENFLPLVVSYMSKSNANILIEALPQALGEGLAFQTCQGLPQETENREQRTENRDLVDPRCIEGGCRGECIDEVLDEGEILAMASRLFGQDAPNHERINVTKLPGFDAKVDRPTLLKIAACRVAGTVSEDWVVSACVGLQRRLEKPDMPRLDRPVNYLCRILLESAPGKLGNRTFQQVMAEIEPRIPSKLMILKNSN